MVDKLKERIANLVDLLTSKKAIVTVGSALLIVWVVKTTPAIVAIAAIASAYLLGQSYVDSKK